MERQAPDIRRFRPREAPLEPFRVSSADIARSLIERRGADPDRVFEAAEETTLSFSILLPEPEIHEADDTDPTVRNVPPPGPKIEHG